MQTLILIATGFFLAVPSQAANVQVEVQKLLQPSQTLNEKLPQSDESVAQCRRAIEDYYTDKLTELRLRTEAAIRLLEVAEKPKPNWAGFAEWAQFAETVLQINGYEHEPFSRIAEKKCDILAQFEWEVANLKRQRERALTAGLAPLELEKRPQERGPKAEPKPTRGLVTGILHSRQDPSAIVDGKIVHEAETIHGAKVIKIHRDRIEFAKNDQTWTQKVQETPKPYWQ